MSKVVEIDNSNAPLLRANKEITLAITGASGALYALNLLRQLVTPYDRVHLLLSDAARVVLATESDLNVPKNPTRCAAFFSEYCSVADGIIVVSSQDNWFSPVASGSAAPKQMVICPASMGCVSAIATGASNNLMERAADVVLKQRVAQQFPDATPVGVLNAALAAEPFSMVSDDRGISSPTGDGRRFASRGVARFRFGCSTRVSLNWQQRDGQVFDMEGYMHQGCL